MSNVKQFPLRDLHVINSLVKKGVSFEDTDKVLALQFYKESIKLLLDRAGTQHEELRSVSRMNNILWKNLMAARTRLKENNKENNNEAPDERPCVR